MATEGAEADGEAEPGTAAPQGAPATTQAPNGKPTSVAKRPRAEKSLPTDRVSISKQVELLRAYGALGKDGTPVTNVAVAKMIEVNPATAGLANAFFLEAGLLVRTPDGLLPTAEVIAYARAYDWNRETAFTKVAPVLRASWFGVALLPKLEFRKQLGRVEALAVLAEAAGASKEHKGQVFALVEYMALAGIVVVDGDIVRAAPREEAAAATAAPSETAPPHAAGGARQAVGAAPGLGQIEFAVRVSVSMAEITKLSPDKITAFFGGLATVMQIQSEIEKARGDGP
jgi:hypothetical protein